MAIVTLDGGQSSAALGGQTIQYVEQLVAMQVAGASDTLITAMLQLVLADFYKKSTGWRAVVSGLSVTTNPLVNLNPVDQITTLLFVLGAYLFPFEGANEPMPLWPLQRMPVGGSPQQPTRYFMQQPDQMLLFPPPDKNYGSILNVYASLIPATTSAILPNYTYTQHVDGLMYGTLSRLYAMKKRPWSDKELAVDFEKKYRREILMARDIANRGFGPADTMIRFPPFAGRAGSQVLPRASG